MKMINHSRRIPGSGKSTVIQVTIIGLCIASGGPLALAQQSVRPTFPSAVEAAQSLFQSVQSNNEQAIANILGAQTDLTSSGEPDQDKVDRELFVQKYQEMHRLRREADGWVVLYIGAENWPFPIPLVNENGAWRFDADAGQKEVLFRRIGEDELTAVATCREFVVAEKNYRAGSNLDPDSSPASLVAKAASGSSNGDPVLLHGYYFRLLPTAAANKTHNRFALIAYPGKYRSSGVMTFIVTENGIVYEKDLGANTSTLAMAMTSFHKDATWRPTGE